MGVCILQRVRAEVDPRELGPVDGLNRSPKRLLVAVRIVGDGLQADPVDVIADPVGGNLDAALQVAQVCLLVQIEPGGVHRGIDGEAGVGLDGAGKQGGRGQSGDTGQGAGGGEGDCRVHAVLQWVG